jgi:hypothetical protein
MRLCWRQCSSFVIFTLISLGPDWLLVMRNKIVDNNSRQGPSSTKECDPIKISSLVEKI